MGKGRRDTGRWHLEPMFSSESGAYIGNPPILHHPAFTLLVQTLGTLRASLLVDVQPHATSYSVRRFQAQ